MIRCCVQGLQVWVVTVMNLTLPPKRHMKKGRSAPQKFPKCYNVNVPFLFKMPPKMGGSSKKDSKFQGEILPIYIFLSYRKNRCCNFCGILWCLNLPTVFEVFKSRNLPIPITLASWIYFWIHPCGWHSENRGGEVGLSNQKTVKKRFGGCLLGRWVWMNLWFSYGFPCFNWYKCTWFEV